jgi:hypothetical protein
VCSRVGVEEVNGKEGKGEGKKRTIHLNLELRLLEVKEVKGDKWGESLYSFHQNLFLTIWRVNFLNYDSFSSLSFYFLPNSGRGGS